MRKSRKATIVIGSTVGALAIGGVAFAYWSTNGSGTGSASTSAGAASAVSISGDVANAMYPGDSTQTWTVTATNTDTDQTAYVSHISAYVTTDKSDCTGADYLINGSTSSAASPVALNWTGVELKASNAGHVGDSA